MIAPAQPVPRRRVTPRWHRPFLDMLPTIRSYAQNAFGYLDAESREDAVALSLADCGERREVFGDPHGAGRRLGVLERTPQQLLRSDDAHRDIVLQSRSLPTRRNSTSGCRGAIDLGWAARLSHHPLR